MTLVIDKISATFLPRTDGALPLRVSQQPLAAARLIR
jgi:hypothetical protein